MGGVLVGCGAEQASEASPSGIALKMELATGTDAKAIRFDYTQVSCGDETTELAHFTSTSPLAEGSLPSGIPEFEDAPLDANSQHRYAENFAVLPAGCYVVVATPLTDKGVPSSDCAQARQKQVRVANGKTTEIFLINQCRGQGRGGVDAISALNRPPVIQNLAFPHSTVASPNQPQMICATVSDPDQDPMELVWEPATSDVPPFQGPSVISRNSNPDGSLTECVSIVPLAVGHYQFRVTVFDQVHAGNGSLIRVEQWLAEQGYPHPSRDTMVFPLRLVGRTLQVAVYLMESIDTCFIGDPCTGSDCVGLRNDANELTEPFTDASFRAVRTNDPAVATAAKVVCVKMTLDAQEDAQIESTLADYRDRVAEWSHGDIQLELRLIRISNADISESRFGGGVWIAPWDLGTIATSRLDFVPDFNVVVPPIRDPQKQLHHDLGGCGGTFGADLGLAGAGWSWVPKTAGSFFFECATQPVFTHEWLHQVHWAYENISNFTDLYGNNFPPCGMGDPDAHKWFPDTHQCNQDPDYERCGLNDCGTADELNSHILGTHWDPAVHFVANTCEDGVQDYGETAVDRGGPCLSFTTAVQPAAVAKSASPPTFKADTPAP